MKKTLTLIKRIVNDGRGYISNFILTGAAGLCIIPIEFYGLLLSRKLIDKGFLLQNWSTTREILFILIVLFVARSAITYGVTLFSTSLQLQLNKVFQSRLFSHLLRLHVPVFDQEPTGKLMSRVLHDAANFSSIFNLIFNTLIFEAIKLSVLIVLLVFFDPRLCLLMIIASLLSLFIIRWMGKKIHVISKEVQEKNSAIYIFIEQMLSNIELVKLKHTEYREIQKSRQLLEEFIKPALKALKITLIAQPFLQIVKYLTLLVVFIYGSWMISKDLQTIGTLTIFIGASYLFFTSVNSLGKSYGFFRDALAKLEVVYSILDQPTEKNEAANRNVTALCVNSVDIKELSFGYNLQALVLQNVSLNIVKGDILGITGHSGSGKTTLIKLLINFYQPQTGQILINGRSIDQIDLDILRATIGIVFQENSILNDSIKNNLLYGNENISIDSMLNAAKIAQAHDFIMDLPDKYETLIGEHGKFLSGGQKQLLAITRAIISNPEILILDEATSFVDVEKEMLVLQKIKDTRKDKITVIISHRASAMDVTKKVIRIENGQILPNDTV